MQESGMAQLCSITIYVPYRMYTSSYVVSMYAYHMAVFLPSNMWRYFNSGLRKYDMTLRVGLRQDVLVKVTFIDDILHLCVHLARHESDEAEDDDSREYTR